MLGERGTMDIAGTLSPETNTWRASVTIHDEAGGVLGTLEILSFSFFSTKNPQI